MSTYGVDADGVRWPRDPECGVPGGGRGRRDRVGPTGVHPLSAGHVPPDAPVRTLGHWGSVVEPREAGDGGSHGEPLDPSSAPATAAAEDAPAGAA